jgi:hypothetical protein
MLGDLSPPIAHSDRRLLVQIEVQAFSTGDSVRRYGPAFEFFLLLHTT